MGPVLLQVDAWNYYWTKEIYFFSLLQQNRAGVLWDAMLISSLLHSYFTVVSFICFQKFQVIWTFHAWFNSFGSVSCLSLIRSSFWQDGFPVYIFLLFLSFQFFFPHLCYSPSCLLSLPSHSFLPFLLSFVSALWLPSVFTLLFVLICSMFYSISLSHLNALSCIILL